MGLENIDTIFHLKRKCCHCLLTLMLFLKKLRVNCYFFFLQFEVWVYISQFWLFFFSNSRHKLCINNCEKRQFKHAILTFLLVLRLASYKLYTNFIVQFWGKRDYFITVASLYLAILNWLNNQNYEFKSRDCILHFLLYNSQLRVYIFLYYSVAETGLHTNLYLNILTLNNEIIQIQWQPVGSNLVLDPIDSHDMDKNS